MYGLRSLAAARVCGGSVCPSCRRMFLLTASRNKTRIARLDELVSDSNLETTPRCVREDGADVCWPRRSPEPLDQHPVRWHPLDEMVNTTAPACVSSLSRPRAKV